MRPPFFAFLGDYALTASRASVATLAIFAPRRGLQKRLLGSLPKPGLWDKLSQSFVGCVTGATAPVPYSCARRSDRATDQYSL